MRIVNTVELKNSTNQILREVHRGSPVAVTRRGKPYAAVVPLDEESLEDFLFEYSPRLKKLVAEAEADVKAGRLTTWGNFLKRERRSSAA